MIGQLSVSQLYVPFEDLLTRGFPHPGHLTVFIAKSHSNTILDFNQQKEIMNPKNELENRILGYFSRKFYYSEVN